MNRCEMRSEGGSHFLRWKQWLAAFAATSVMLSSTVDTVWMTNHTYLVADYRVLLVNTSFIIIGGILGVVFADIYGRKRTLLVASLFVIPRIASLNIVSANLSWINKMFMDIGSGILCTVVPLYISEIADANNRGTLMVLQLSVFTFGALVSNAAYTVFISNHIIQWYGIVSNVLLIIPTLFHVITLALLPETPYYLNWKKRYQEAAQSLAFFRGVSHVKVIGDASGVPINSHPNNEERHWNEKFREIIRFENRRSLAIIFSLIAIKWATGQQRNEFGLLMSMPKYGWSDSFLPGMWAVKFIFTVCLMFAVDFAGGRVCLSIVILTTFISTIILILPFAKYHFVVLGSFSVPILGHIVFAAVEIAYLGSFFSINVRGLASAAVISFDVLIRNVAYMIDEQLRFSMRLVPFAISSAVLFCAFFFVLIFFPKTNKDRCSEIMIEMPVNEGIASGNI